MQKSRTSRFHQFLGKIGITVFKFYTVVLMIVIQYIETVFCFEVITDNILSFPTKFLEKKLYFQAIINISFFIFKKNYM